MTKSSLSVCLLTKVGDECSHSEFSTSMEFDLALTLICIENEKVLVVCELWRRRSYVWNVVQVSRVSDELMVIVLFLLRMCCVVSMLRTVAVV